MKQVLNFLLNVFFSKPELRKSTLAMTRLQDSDIQDVLKNMCKNIIKAKELSHHLKVVDIGCADIRPYSLFLIDYFDEYVGIDISSEAIKRGKEKIRSVPDSNFVVENAENISFEGSFFDVVVCNNMIAYTNKKMAIGEMLRVLKKGGW